MVPGRDIQKCEDKTCTASLYVFLYKKLAIIWLFLSDIKYRIMQALSLVLPL